MRNQVPLLSFKGTTNIIEFSHEYKKGRFAYKELTLHIFSLFAYRFFNDS
jgi:hypothetical protein